MLDRKQLKRSGRENLKKHYLLLVLICALAAFFGIQYAGTLAGYGLRTAAENPTEIAVIGELGTKGVLDHMFDGEPEKGKKLSDELEVQAKSKATHVSVIELGRSRGVFATMLNSYESGSIYVTLWSAVSSIIGSRSVSIAVFIVICLIVAAFFQFFVVDVFRAILKRIVLEARIYYHVPAREFLYLLRWKRWFKAAIGLLYTQLFRFLWDLTIIGGIIKRYSYALVPYIIAENPDISARDALNLSKRMMKGHKWELFVFDLSFIGWWLLGLLTFGLLNIFFVNPYREAATAEYYAVRRAQVKAEEMEGSQLLNDVYLYEYADRQTVEAAYASEKAQAEQDVPGMPVYKGISGFFAKTFGIVLSYNSREKQYMDCVSGTAKQLSFNKVIQGEEYPEKLNSLAGNARFSDYHIYSLRYNRHYSITSLIIMFFVMAIVGWLWEVGFTLVTTGMLVNRGTLHGPLLPIYGCGCVFLLITLNKLRRRPIAAFAVAVVLCGILEYGTSVVLEQMFNKKWWDYSGFFMNINGRVCAEGLLVFGVGGMLFIYLIAPLLDNIIQKIRLKYLVPLCIALLIMLTADIIYSANHPNTGEGINAACVQKVENTYYQRMSKRF